MYDARFEAPVPKTDFNQYFLSVLPKLYKVGLPTDMETHAGDLEPEFLGAL